MSTELAIPDAAVVERRALSVLEQANAIAIASSAQYVGAAELLKAVKATQAEINETFDPAIAAAHKAHRAALDAKARHYAPTEQAERVIKTKLRQWDDEQETKRREEQRQREAEAREAETTRRLAEAAALEREAVATGDASLLAEAEAIISEPVEAPVVIVAKTTPTVAGISYREVWDYEVVNDNLIPREFLVRDDKRIAAVVRAMKGSTKIPGIRAFARKVVAAGGGK